MHSKLYSENCAVVYFFCNGQLNTVLCKMPSSECERMKMYGTIAQGDQCLYSPCRQDPASLCVESHRLQHTAQCQNHKDRHTINLRTQKPTIRDLNTQNTQITDLLYTNCSHGWLSGEAGLEVAQDFLHTLTENTVHYFILLIDDSRCEE